MLLNVTLHVINIGELRQSCPALVLSTPTLFSHTICKVKQTQQNVKGKGVGDTSQ